MEGPHTCSPPSNPHPPEDVIRAKLTVILRLWRPVTGCFELKQKTHYNPKRPWKKLRKYPPSLAVRRWVGYSVSRRPSAWSAPEPSPLLSFPFRFYLTGVLVAVTSEIYSFHCRLWWKKKGTNKLLAGKHSACASLMVSLLPSSRIPDRGRELQQNSLLIASRRPVRARSLNVSLQKAMKRFELMLPV